MANFNAARAAIPAEIAVDDRSIRQGVENRTPGQAVKAFGALGGEIRKGLIKNELTRDLQNLSLEVNALNEAVPGENGEVDLSQQDPDGTLKDASNGTERLKRARLQGKLSLNQVALEGEALLRKAVAKAPGFEPELRQLVADAVGFDVTGAATRTFFGNGRPDAARGPLTPLEKRIQDSVALAASSGGRMDQQTAFEFLGAKEIAAGQQAIDNQKLQAGRIKTAEYAHNAGVNLQNDGMALIFSMLDDEGNIQEGRDARFEIKRLTQRYQAMASSNAVENGTIGPDSMQFLETHFTSMQNSLLEMVEDKDFMNVLADNMEVLVNQAVVDVEEVLPGLRRINLAFGSEATAQFMRQLASLHNSPEAIQREEENDPIFGRNMEILRQFGAEELLDGFATIKSGGGGEGSQAEVDRNLALSQNMTSDALREGNGADASNAIQYQYSRGMSRKPLSQVAQQPGAYSLLDEVSRAQTLDRYGVEVATTRANITAQLAQNNERLVYEPHEPLFGPPTMRFKIVSATGINATAQRIASGSGNFGGSGASAATAEVAFLNDTLLAMQVNNPQFRIDGKIENTNAWGQFFVNDVNDGVDTENEPKAFVGPEGQPLTELEAGKSFADAQGNVFIPGEGKITRVVRAGSNIPFIETTKEVPVEGLDEDMIDAIRVTADEFDIPQELALAVAWQETGGKFNLDAKNKKSGAIGLFQLLPSTAADLGVDPNNPKENIQGGIDYLSEQLERFGTIELALAAYNWGPGNVRRALKAGVDFFNVPVAKGGAPKETKDYVKQVMERAGIESS